jgi:hypothetical protein
MEERTLYVDSINNHSNEENCISVHPSHLNYIDAFDKEAFNKIIIKNSPLKYLKAKGLFNINRALKTGGICEIIVDQPIMIMQDLDANEIEANCKLAGFNDINTENYSSIENVKGIENRIQTLKLVMVK